VHFQEDISVLHQHPSLSESQATNIRPVRTFSSTHTHTHTHTHPHTHTVSFHLFYIVVLFSISSNHQFLLCLLATFNSGFFIFSVPTPSSHILSRYKMECIALHNIINTVTLRKQQIWSSNGNILISYNAASILRWAKELHLHNQAYSGLDFGRRIERGRILYDSEIMRSKKYW
jgi:hypothetical protein